jgi:hypothetical protein
MFDRLQISFAPFASFARHQNPNGIPSFSPGLARSDYPGSAVQKISTLKGLHQIRANRFNPFRVVVISFHHPA